MNPVLPFEHFVPDSEARVWDDGAVYVYGSYDISGNSTYCSREYRVFSSHDLVHWRDHGVSFATDPAVARSAAADDPRWREQTLYAPDCVRYRGSYRLFFCTSSKGEGVATSPNPAGPFENPIPVDGADGDAIDPAAFVDDDGTPYLFWGQFNARGARLREDLKGIEKDTLAPSLMNENDHGFHEGSSLRKRGDIYYLVYADISRGRPTCLGYATARAPLGPYTKGGVIIDNTGCDPETWNNHGSIERVGDRWYVFYHRSSQGSRYNRRLCIEPIEFDATGAIAEVEMTTSGVSGPLDPTIELDAARACVLDGGARIEPADSAVGGEVLTTITDGASACFRYFDYDLPSSPATRFAALASSNTYGGSIEIRLDAPDGELLGVCRVDPTGDWRTVRRFETDVTAPSGVHALWLVFHGTFGRLFDLKSFSFR